MERKKFKEPLILKVLIFDIELDKQIREHIVDFSVRDKRKWLSSVVVWATLNNKSVEVYNIEDDG